MRTNGGGKTKSQKLGGENERGGTQNYKTENEYYYCENGEEAEGGGDLP